ncbi:hypothetical protein TRVL_01996 [Trypanosoma vivax]|nr:hypothetical protein TRVL_01996 [Trypanosoma vivax]
MPVLFRVASRTASFAICQVPKRHVAIASAYFLGLPAAPPFSTTGFYSAGVLTLLPVELGPHSSNPPFAACLVPFLRASSWRSLGSRQLSDLSVSVSSTVHSSA